MKSPLKSAPPNNAPEWDGQALSLSDCRALAQQLYELGSNDSQVSGWLSQRLPLFPTQFSPRQHELLKALHLDAARQQSHAPRQSWALAQLASAMAGQLQPDRQQAPAHRRLLAHCHLTLASILNVLGRFAESSPLLQPAATVFLEDNQPLQAARCQVELALGASYQDDFDTARAALAQARALLSNDDHLLPQAHYDRAAGLRHLLQNQYQPALDLLQQAKQRFVRANEPAEAALTGCHLADTLVYTDPHAALVHLDRARRLDPSPLLAARCDATRAFIFVRLNRYKESLPLFQRARQTFIQEDMHFRAARCDLERGMAHYGLNQYRPALHLFGRARAIFAAQGINSRVAMCDLNMGNIYYDLNRYAEALALYEAVAEAAQAEGRLLRVARCHTNMGLCYHQLGRYDRALVFHRRALQAFRNAGDTALAAAAQENLAGTYRALGRYDQALSHYDAARQTFIDSQLAVNAAYCDMQLADLHLARQQFDQAKSSLTRARQLYAKNGMVAYQAACDRRLAMAGQALADPAIASVFLEQARQAFVTLAMPVELALCDLTEGRLRLANGELHRAVTCFQQAEHTLRHGFPDQAWLAAEGLARCALAQNNLSDALDYYMLAASRVSQARKLLPTEQLRSDYLAERQHVFQAGIELALNLNMPQKALALIEASKAHSVLIPQNLWRIRQHAVDDPYLEQLLERAAALRRQLDTLRAQVMVPDQEFDPGHLATETKIGLPQSVVELSQLYEEVIEELRIMAASPAPDARPFNLDTFRQAAAIHLNGTWACLEYFMLADRLVIHYLDAHTLKSYTRPLSNQDHWILEQCLSPDDERRRLVYQDTIRGFTVPNNPGQAYRRHLARLLLPPEIVTLSTWDLLIVAPHAALHHLPFHTLLDDSGDFIERGPLLYVPSLQLLQQLWGQHSPANRPGKTLVCGVDTFGNRAAPLAGASREVEAVSQVLGPEATPLCGPAASVTQLKAMSVAGQLAHYEAIHFATHTVTDPATPLLSRVLLADDDLTVVDILELDLAARLVTLSTCQTAVGAVTAGDEMMTLARAFFYAGSQTVVASLWPVEDEAAIALMQNFYQQLRAGHPIPQALRLAQQSMRQAGYTPYQWAPFVVIGRP